MGNILMISDRIVSRTLEEANYLVENKSTIRDTAKYFKVSKSTLYVDLSEKLPKIDKELYKKVKEVLMDNKKSRALRGGLSHNKRSGFMSIVSILEKTDFEYEVSVSLNSAGHYIARKEGLRIDILKVKNPASYAVLINTDNEEIYFRVSSTKLVSQILNYYDKGEGTLPKSEYHRIKINAIAMSNNI